MAEFSSVGEVSVPVTVSVSLDNNNVPYYKQKRCKTVRELILLKRKGNCENTKQSENKNNVLNCRRQTVRYTLEKKRQTVFDMLHPIAPKPTSNNEGMFTNVDSSETDTQIKIESVRSEFQLEQGDSALKRNEIRRRKRRRKRLPSDEVDPNMVEEIMRKYPAIAPKSGENAAKEKLMSAVENKDAGNEFTGTILQAKENVQVEPHKEADIKEVKRPKEHRIFEEIHNTSEFNRNLYDKIHNLKLKDLSLDDMNNVSLDDILHLGILELVKESEIEGLVNRMEEAVKEINKFGCRNGHKTSQIRVLDMCSQNNHSEINEIDSATLPADCDKFSSEPAAVLESQNSDSSVTEQSSSAIATIDLEKEQFMNYFSLQPNISKETRKKKHNYNKYMEILKGRYKDYMRNPSIPLARIKHFYWYLKWQENKNKSIPAGSELKKYEGRGSAGKNSKSSNSSISEKIDDASKLENNEKKAETSLLQQNPACSDNKPPSISQNIKPAPVIIPSASSQPVLLLIPSCSNSGQPLSNYQPNVMQSSVISLPSFPASRIPTSTILTPPNVQVVPLPNKTTVNSIPQTNLVNSLQGPLVLNTSDNQAITILPQSSSVIQNQMIAPGLRPIRNSTPIQNTIQNNGMTLSCVMPGPQVYTINSQTGSIISPIQTATNVVTNQVLPACNVVLSPTRKSLINLVPITSNTMQSASVNNSVTSSSAVNSSVSGSKQLCEKTLIEKEASKPVSEKETDEKNSEKPTSSDVA